MKRRAFKLLLFLLAGAIINVAVAWSCVRSVYAQGEWTFLSRAEESRLWKFAPVKISPQQFVSATAQSTYGSEVMIATARLRSTFVPAPDLTKDGVGYTGPKVPEGATSVEITQDAFLVVRKFGWPMRSLCYFNYDAPGKSRAIGTWVWSSRAPAVPISLLWPGFAINTIFYAAIVWLLFFVPFELRRWRRIKRGQCASCGYSLRGTTSEKCPECGAQIK